MKAAGFPDLAVAGDGREDRGGVGRPEHVSHSVAQVKRHDRVRRRVVPQLISSRQHHVATKGGEHVSLRAVRVPGLPCFTADSLTLTVQSAEQEMKMRGWKGFHLTAYTAMWWPSYLHKPERDPPDEPTEVVVSTHEW